MNAFAMTAIFMVWNTTGFALAADDSVSVTSLDSEGIEKTLWTDTGEKIFRPEDHKLAVALAADMKVNNIPVSHLLSMWQSNLSTEMNHLTDYVINFLNFLPNCDFPENYQYRNNLIFRCNNILGTVKTEFETNPTNVSSFIKDIIQRWSKVEPSNIYGSLFKDEVSNYTTSEDPGDEMTNEFSRNWVQNSKFDYNEKAINELVIGVIEESFETTFDYPWDKNIDWHQSIINHLVPYLINKVDAENSTHLLFVGYGTKDWVPHMVKLSIHPFAAGLPRADIKLVANPFIVWYESLAQSDQVDLFLSGYESSYHSKVSALLPEEAKAEILAQLEELESERISEMRKKVNNLSLTKLEFVARSFVEMESLGSFLVEYLPSVGGDIKVISMTR
jgi:hypothetical protein